MATAMRPLQQLRTTTLTKIKRRMAGISRQKLPEVCHLQNLVKTAWLRMRSCKEEEKEEAKEEEGRGQG